MNTERVDVTHESRQSLWLLVVSPSIWAAHFLLSYVTAAVWCAKTAERGGSLGPVRPAIAVYSAAALVAIAWNARVGWRRYRHESAATQHADTPPDRHRFLGFATLLLAGLSFGAVAFVAGAAFSFEDCR
jgi:hypothetical protein